MGKKNKSSASGGCFLIVFGLFFAGVPIFMLASMFGNFKEE